MGWRAIYMIDKVKSNVLWEGVETKKRKKEKKEKEKKVEHRAWE